MVLDIYTDAGGCGTRRMRIGAVVVNQNDPDYIGYKFSKKTTVGEVKMKLGFIEEQFQSNSTIAEMVCIQEILKEIHLLNTNIDSINIYTDSMITFNIYNGLQKKVKCELIKRIFASIKMLKGKLKTEINVMWVRGHSGTWGNEVADSLCKSNQVATNEIKQLVLQR